MEKSIFKTIFIFNNFFSYLDHSKYKILNGTFYDISLQNEKLSVIKLLWVDPLIIIYPNYLGILIKNTQQVVLFHYIKNIILIFNSFIRGFCNLIGQQERK